MAVGGTCERESLAQLAATSQCLSGKRSYAETPGITKSDEGITVCSIVTAMCTIHPSVCAKSLLRAKLRVPTFGRLVNHHRDATKCPSLNAVCRAQRNDREDCTASALRMTRSIKEKLPFFWCFLWLGASLTCGQACGSASALRALLAQTVVLLFANSHASLMSQPGGFQCSFLIHPCHSNTLLEQRLLSRAH